MTRTFTELDSIRNFDDRFAYLKVTRKVADPTFGSDRYLNQAFYTSYEWKRIRDEVVSRDNGFDMGHRDFPIRGAVYVHHMNPMTLEDLLAGDDSILAPEYLICVSHRTHNAIHYGDSNLLPSVPLTRTPNDTVPWRR